MKLLDYIIFISVFFIFFKIIIEWYMSDYIFNYFFIKRNFQEEQDNPVPVEDTFFKMFDLFN